MPLIPDLGPLGPIAPTTMPPAPPGPSGFAQFQQIMQLVLPVLAAAGAYRKGELGSFTRGMLEGQQVQQRQQHEQRDYEMRRQSMEHQRHTEERAIQEAEYRKREAETTRRLAAEKQMRDVLQDALKPLEENEMYREGIPADVAERLVITVPGIDPINLRKAFEKVGVLQQDGKYFYGKLAKPELAPVPSPTGKGAVYGTKKPGEPVYEREPRPPLVSDYSNGDTATLVEAKPGTRVRARPREPREPVKPVRRAYTVKGDNPDDPETFGKTYRVVEDEDGNVLSMKEIKLGSPSAGSGAGRSSLSVVAPNGKTYNFATAEEAAAFRKSIAAAAKKP
jgi:hypothetical protein